jgi:hypothetical protein
LPRRVESHAIAAIAVSTAAVTNHDHAPVTTPITTSTTTDAAKPPTRPGASAP